MRGQVGSKQRRGELALILAHQFVVAEQPEDRDHRLARVFSDPLAVALYQVEGDLERLGILAGCGEGVGQGQLELEVVGVGRRGSARGLDSAGRRALCAQGELGLKLLSLRLEKPAPLKS